MTEQSKKYIVEYQKLVKWIKGMCHIKVLNKENI